VLPLCGSPRKKAINVLKVNARPVVQAGQESPVKVAKAENVADRVVNA
jgi:hypothetical protein